MAVSWAHQQQQQQQCIGICFVWSGNEQVVCRGTATFDRATFDVFNSMSK